MNHLLSTPFILLLLVLSKASANFFRTAGRDILNPQGEVFISKGINLNGWLLPEAYGMRIDSVHDRHMNAMSDIQEQIQTLLGGSEEDAAEFWDSFIANHVTKQDIMDLANVGFNAIRLPFNFRLVSPLNTPGEYSEEGFQMLDMVISWCRNAGLAILLDMHACPGGQSHDAYADPEYTYWQPSVEGDMEWFERGVQVMWEYNDEYFQSTGRTPEFNKNRTAQIWRTIAERYKDEPTILGYELANEPYYYASSGVTDEDLRLFFMQVTEAVREVDTNHIVFVEGNIFAEEVGGLLPPFDDNMAIAFHRYWRETGYADGVVQHYLDARDEYNVPFLMTESGENSDPWIYEIRQLMEGNDIGWFFWGFKKVDGIAVHYEVRISEDYQYVIDHWRDAEPDQARIKKGLMEYAEASKSENCRIQPGYFAAMFDPDFAQIPRAFAQVSLPGTVYAVHYDIGNQGIAYQDTRYKNEEYEGTGWNLGWTYRNDGVDVAITADDSVETSIGYHVFSMETGEWMKYTVNVATDGMYAVFSRARSSEGKDGRFALSVSAEKNLDPNTTGEMDGALVVQVPGALTDWAYTTQGSTVYLPAGEQVVTLKVIEGGMELAWIEFVLLNPGGPEEADSGKAGVSEGSRTSRHWCTVLIVLAGFAGLLAPSTLFEIS